MDSFPTIRQTDLQLELDDRPLAKRVGLVILATDHTTEPDFQRMVASNDIGLYTSRIPYANPTTPENLRRMLQPMSEGAWMILPDEELDAICYSCTSASVVIGDDEVENALQLAKPNVPVVTPTRAAVKGLQAFSAKKISILTPYTIETSTPMAAYFSGKGFEIANFTCFGLDDDREMARISTKSLVTAARETIASDAEALFISCTAVRAATIAAELEQAIGKPVVTSNLATAWATLRICGEHTPRPELGSLMAQPMASW